MDFDLLSAAFFDDPFPTLAAMRSNAPCWYDPRLGAHVLTRYQDIAWVLRDDEHFSAQRVAQFGHGAPEGVRAKLEAYNRTLERWLLFRDRPAHAALRRYLGQAFGANQRPMIDRGTRAAVEAALARLQAAEAPDLVRDFAIPVPTTVLAAILGIPTPDIELFKRWTLDIFALIGAGIADAETVEAGHRGASELGDYVLALLRDRRANPRDDVLSRLARPASGAEHTGIDDQDLVGLFMAMIVAGHETTTNLLANSLHTVVGDRQVRASIVERGGVDMAVVDELVRHDGSAFSMIRRARRDVELGGQRVREGEYVFSILHAGNRDPAAFDAPERLLFDRPARPAHLGFGAGPHACMGAAMARTVVAISMNVFLQKWPQATLAPGHARVHNLSLRGFSSLPIRLGAPATRPARVAEPGAGQAARRGRVAAGEPLPDLAENEPRRVSAVVHASDTDAVRDLVLTANRQGLPLYPVSTGRNWGLGSRSPVEDGCVLLELGGMNRIRTLDLEHGIAVIEPGVTQGMLADRLAGSPFLLNVTTSCRDTSVIGNALDRGQGMLRLRDEDLLGLEVVLGNGDLVTTGILGPPRTGLAGLAGAVGAVGAVGEHRAGPDATRLFCQSNFGVVTAAAIALVHRPERTAFIHATFADAALSAVVDRVSRLRRERVLGHICYLGDMQIEPGRQARPDFTLLGPLLGRRRIVAEALELLRDELAAIPGCRSLRTADVEELAPANPLYHRGRAFLGIPSCEPLRRRFGVTSCDLDHEATRGWSVVQTSLPLDGAAAVDALAVLAAGVDAWGLPVQPHLSSVSDRTLNLMTMIGFPRDARGIERMRGLRDDLRTKLGERGFRPSREGIDALRRPPSRLAHDAAWARLKNAFDPNGVIAPGRYGTAVPMTAPAVAPATRGACALRPRPTGRNVLHPTTRFTK